MKNIRFALLLSCLLSIAGCNGNRSATSEPQPSPAAPEAAPTVESIHRAYVEALGGAETIANLRNLKAEVRVIGTPDTPPVSATLYLTTDGKRAFESEFEGRTVRYDVFDGETHWTTDLETLEASRSSHEKSTNEKRGKNGFISYFLNYKDKGFTAVLLDEEVIHGVECYQVELTLTPEIKDGVERENIRTFFIDKESHQLIMEQGEFQGEVVQVTHEDVRTIAGVTMPTTQKTIALGETQEYLAMDNIEFNADINDNIFQFPGNIDVTAAQIHERYITAIGGKEKIAAIQNTKMEGLLSPEPEVAYPVTAYQTREGKKVILADFDGMQVGFDAFDGEVYWTTNLDTLQQEKGDAETSENVRRNRHDMINHFIFYQEKGYQAEFIGEATLDGIDYYRVKLTLKPFLDNGNEEENSEVYYFNKATYLPMLVKMDIKEGEWKGTEVELHYNDYQTNAQGITLPMMVSTVIAGEPGRQVKLSQITTNVEIDQKIFAYRGE